MPSRKNLDRCAKHPISRTVRDVVPIGMAENGAEKAEDGVRCESTRVEVSFDIGIPWFAKLKVFFSRDWR